MAQDVQVIIPHIHTAYPHGTAFGIVQAGDQLHQAGLCAAGAADDAQRLAGLDGKGDIVQHRTARTMLILKGNMVELDAAVLHLLHRLLGRGQVGGLVQHFHDTLGGSGRHGDHHKDHAQHHQGHEDVHDVSEQGVELTGGDGTVQHIFSAQPAQGDVAAVNGGEHGRVVEAQAALGLDELVVQALAGLGVLLVLKALAHKALDHTDGGHVFLHRGVEVIVVLEHAVKDVEGGDHDAGQHHHQKDYRHHEHQRQRAADDHSHEQCKHQMHRGTHAHALDHLERILHVGHVGGHTGDKARRGELVDVGEGIVLDVLIHGIAQIAGKAGGCLGGIFTGQNAQQQRNGCHKKGEQTILDDGVHIALFNAQVNDKGHDGGQQHIHHGFQGCKERCQDCGAFVLAQM